jgi:hypothetical protein
MGDVMLVVVVRRSWEESRPPPALFFDRGDLPSGLELGRNWPSWRHGPARMCLVVDHEGKGTGVAKGKSIAIHCCLGCWIYYTRLWTRVETSALLLPRHPRPSPSPLRPTMSTTANTLRDRQVGQYREMVPTSSKQY